VSYRRLNSFLFGDSNLVSSFRNAATHFPYWKNFLQRSIKSFHNEKRVQPIMKCTRARRGTSGKMRALIALLT
jgi:hypothetical protein